MRNDHIRDGVFFASFANFFANSAVKKLLTAKIAKDFREGRKANPAGF
jgi:hypothetical protein